MQIDLQVWFVVCLQSVVNGKLNTDRDYCFVFVSRHFKARYSISTNQQNLFLINKTERKIKILCCLPFPEVWRPLLFNNRPKKLSKYLHIIFYL